MALSFTLTQEQYEALIAMAAAGASTPDQARQLDSWLRLIEKANGITRSIVWVQWQEIDSPLPAGTNFPDVWPPELRQKIELISRPVAKADVDALIAAKARNPINILCTKDPAGILGYIPYDSFFVA